MGMLRQAVICGVIVAGVVVGSRSVAPAAYGASPAFQTLETPSFVQAGKRYAFTWSGGGPAQTYTVKSVRSDGWVLVDVAEETINPAFLVPGDFPTRWLNVALAISIQEMRPVVQ
jgi:hypothetical protein